MNISFLSPHYCVYIIWLLFYVLLTANNTQNNNHIEISHKHVLNTNLGNVSANLPKNYMKNTYGVEQSDCGCIVLSDKPISKIMNTGFYSCDSWQDAPGTKRAGFLLMICSSNGYYTRLYFPLGETCFYHESCAGGVTTGWTRFN